MGYVQRIKDCGGLPGSEISNHAAGEAEGGRADTQLADFTFPVGVCVTHITQRLQSLVVGQIRASNGLELYSLRSYARVDCNRDRIVLAGSLRRARAGSEDCDGCLLLGTELCPGE